MPIRRNSSTSKAKPRDDEDDEDRYEDDDAVGQLPDDEEEQEERPSRSRRKPAEDDEEERPARSRRRTTRDEDEDDEDLEDEDEDEQPARSSRVARGWAAAKKLKAEGGDYAPDLKIEDEPVLVKFMEDEPFAVFRQHFLRERKEGKKSFKCPGKGCPLCGDLGHTPDRKFAFNVVNLSEEPPVVQVLFAGPRLLTVLEKKNEGRTGPLSKHYWEISKAGKGTQTTYTLEVVKERDLEEEFEVDPAEIAKSIKGLKPYDGSIIKDHTKAELRDLADELSE